MVTIKDKKDWVTYHVDYLNKNHETNFFFDKKHNQLYIQSPSGYRKPIYEAKNLDCIIAYIDWIYTGLKILIA